jgi:hypothetical protein
MSRQDNSVMKTIALLTMIFLPATFISVCTHDSGAISNNFPP